MDRYEQISVVGEGSYGLVMKCKHKETEQIVAIKKFLETEEDTTIRKMALREIRMLKRLKHENLVTLIDVFRHRKRFYLVFEFIEGTVLDELEKMSSGLSEELCRERIYQVIRAINFCHSNHIIHRDVKPENILVSAQGVVKLCDFGFARLVSISGEPCTEYVATRWYRAPELLVGEANYGPPVDVWAIGCLFAEMMTGEPLFPGESDIDQLYLIVKMLGKPCVRHQQLMMRNSQLRNMVKSAGDTSALYKQFSQWSLYAFEFLTACIRMDPQSRFNSDELLKVNYFVHDNFPEHFLPVLRDKITTEFNTKPLLRKFKTEVLMATDKKDEIKVSRMKFGVNVKGGGDAVKRKYSCDLFVNSDLEKPVISLTRITPAKQMHKITEKRTNAAAEMALLEKSLESLVKFNNNRDDTKSPIPQQYHHHYQQKVPGSPVLLAKSSSLNLQHVLRPTINNITLNNKDLAAMRKIPVAVNGGSGFSLRNPFSNQQMPASRIPQQQLLKKEKINTLYEQFDGGSTNNNDKALWLNSFSTNLHKRREFPERKTEEFTLPNLPGVMVSPRRNRRKPFQETETETPRNQSANVSQIHSASILKSCS